LVLFWFCFVRRTKTYFFSKIMNNKTTLNSIINTSKTLTIVTYPIYLNTYFRKATYIHWKII
jgi:hypothetical protein